MSDHLPDFGFSFDNSYARDLEGLYVPLQGEQVPEPKVALLNHALAAELGLSSEALLTNAGARVLAGMTTPPGAMPLAQAYAGHQFGGFSPQLGDGRALLLGELVGQDRTRVDLHLKGSGRTPFSRGGDGKAVLGPVLREYLMGEAMHHLGIPSTRALSVVTTGQEVMRDTPKQGAVLGRIAASHLRIGTFQFFAARGETEQVRRLADYAINRHYPELTGHAEKYLELLKRVIARQAELVAKWMHVGFVHGVMNTDNMTISGETIDYGPCAFMEAYDPATVYSSIDRHGRYAFGNQPVIAQWNLARFAETLITLLSTDSEQAIEMATQEINRFASLYSEAWLRGMRAKIGLTRDMDSDADLISDLLELMRAAQVDYTRGFRSLSGVLVGQDSAFRDLFGSDERVEKWLSNWQHRLEQENVEALACAQAMDQTNPLYIPRNHLVEQALTAAETEGDLHPFQTLLEVVSDPYTYRPEQEVYSQSAPEDFGPYRTFCGT